MWVQIVDMCQVLREEAFLKIIGEQIGQVISIDNYEAYRAKLFGPRIRLLVRDLHKLPQFVVIPRLDGVGTVEYSLEFSGLPKQCGRCRAHDHQVRNCPKKVQTARKNEGPYRHTTAETTEPVELQVDNKETPMLPTRGKEAPDRPKIVDRRETTEVPESVETSADNKEKSTVQEGVQQSKNSLNENNNTPLDTSGTQERSRTPITSQKDGLFKASDVTSQQVSLLKEVSCKLTQESKGALLDQTEWPQLQPDDVNFPKLQTPTSVNKEASAKKIQDASSKNQEPRFVWQATHLTKPTKKMADGTKGKGKLPDSTPLTRQRYRSGRLAEDFWEAIGMPNTPSTNPKMLRVIPFLTKNRNTECIEYLVDKRGKSFSSIAHVHVAEVLAGIPWTQIRARQHVVNEVSQALQKILIFNNNLSNPFQEWNQGRWYAQWGKGEDGEYICTLFVSVDVPKHKVKPRKGVNMGWRREPTEVSIVLTSTTTEEIQVVEPNHTLWKKMAGRLPMTTTELSAPESHNRFVALLESEVVSEQ